MPGIFIEPTELAAIREVDSIEFDHARQRTEMPKHIRQLTALAPSDEIEADCHTDYTAVHNSGRRPIDQIWWVVVHSTEGYTALAAATWFQNPKSGGSTHLVVDDNICYRTLPNTVIPWGAQGANYHGFHIEQAGFAKWVTLLWSKTHRRTLQRAAYKAAYHCSLFKIPITWVSADGLALGVKGITSHNECSKAFGGTHWDPGPGWPRWLFMSLVRYYYKRLHSEV